MASTSEITFGARLNRAEQMATHLQSFVGYQAATPDCAVPQYQALIDQIKTNNISLATQSAAFSLAVDARQKLFTKEPNSLQKLLSPIASYVRARFGKTSPEADLVVALVNKIRGEKTTQLKKDAEGEFVSQSERSYGSMTQNFSDLINTLQSFGQNYHPSNVSITAPKLLELLELINAANHQVTVTYGQLKPTKDNRITLFDELNSRSTRIKENVKSQYGNSSTEYKLIKGLKI